MRKNEKLKQGRPQKVSDEKLMEYMAQGLSYAEIGRLEKMASSSIRERCLLLNTRGYSPQHNHTKIAPPGFSLKGTSTLYDNDGNPIMQWVKTNKDDAARQQLMTETLEIFKQEITVAKPKKASGKYSKNMMACYIFGDPHIGMYADPDETQDAAWDLEISSDTHNKAIAEMIEYTPNTESCLIVNLGDLLHFDSLEPKTPRSGHIVDASGRYGAIIKIAAHTMITMIETALTKHKTVNVISAIGNHDETGAQWLALLLAQRYHNEPRVSIDTNASVFNYFIFGENLIGVHHGHTVRKIEQLPNVMAVDKPKEWGDSKNRFWWTGHIHHQQTKELPGCIVESFGTLAPKDQYATNGGWRSRRSACAIVLHKTKGDILRYYYQP